MKITKSRISNLILCLLVGTFLSACASTKENSRSVAREETTSSQESKKQIDEKIRKFHSSKFERNNLF